jgi:hypothetical protein
MRTLAIAFSFVIGIAGALAQGAPANKSPADSQHSTGRTVIPDEKGQQQPQGPTGPLNTTAGGAPPESPQGQTPPGMQSAPDGSSKTIVEPKGSAR